MPSATDDGGIFMFDEEIMREYIARELGNCLCEGPFRCNDPGDLAPGSVTMRALQGMEVFYQEHASQLVRWGLNRGFRICRQAEAEPQLFKLDHESVALSWTRIAIVFIFAGPIAEAGMCAAKAHIPMARDPVTGPQNYEEFSSTDSYPGSLASSYRGRASPGLGPEPPQMKIILSQIIDGGRMIREMLLLVEPGDYIVLAPGEAVRRWVSDEDGPEVDDMSVIWSEHRVFATEAPIVHSRLAEMMDENTEELAGWHL